jgi:transcriptional antiterminator RfaH
MSKECWYVLTTKSHNEARAAANLCNQGVETYFPQITVEKIIKGVKVNKTEALFPGYLFIKMNAETANFNSLRSTRGVLAFIRFGPELAIVDDALIHKIQYDLRDNENKVVKDTLMKSGENVVITDGPFAGLEADLHRADGLERSILFLNMMNARTPVAIANKHLAKKL